MPKGFVIAKLVSALDVLLLGLTLNDLKFILHQQILAFKIYHAGHGIISGSVTLIYVRLFFLLEMERVPLLEVVVVHIIKISLLIEKFKN